MFDFISLFVAFLFVAGAGPANQNNAALMDQVDDIVIMPDGAEPINAYSRHYAFAGPDRVIAIYLLPSSFADPAEDEGCSVMSDDFELRPCTDVEIEEMEAMLVEVDTSTGNAGEQRWHEDLSTLPFILDGGCTQISIEFEVSSQRVVSVSCNDRLSPPPKAEIRTEKSINPGESDVPTRNLSADAVHRYRRWRASYGAG